MRTQIYVNYIGHVVRRKEHNNLINMRAARVQCVCASHSVRVTPTHTCGRHSYFVYDHECLHYERANDVYVISPSGEERYYKVTIRGSRYRGQRTDTYRHRSCGH